MPRPFKCLWGYYIPAIEKAIKKAKQSKESPAVTFTPGWLGNYFTRLMTVNKNGVPSTKMKAPKNYTMSNEGNSDIIIATFIEQQEKLLVLLEDAKNVNLDTIRIPVSIARFIKLKLGDVFMFLIAHNLRHIKQAERAIAVAQSLQPKVITGS